MMDPDPQPDQRENPQPVRTGPTTDYLFALPLENRISTSNQQTTDNAAGPSSTEDGGNPANIENAARKKPGIPIRNFIFPILKCFRKLNNKLTTASHHYEFLTELRSNHQTPRGLKVKVATTTAELPPQLHQRWETAHIELGNTLRDILIDYWQEICVRIRLQMDNVY